MNKKNNNNLNDGAIALRPKARILKTLGEELISSETVAIIELVKNAYDADACNVLIEFSGDLATGSGSVSVYDDGHGMDMKVIRNAWMVIATSEKKNQHKSNSGKRRVLGEKGIGRFAASRIAAELELITRTPNNSNESYAVFDWKQFEDDDLFLDQVLFLAEDRNAEDIVEGWPLSEYREYEKSESVNGTILQMNELKHTWEKKDFDELQRGLSRLISPFNPVSDFDIYVKLPEKYGDLTTKIETPEIIKYPHYKVKGSVDEFGAFSFSVLVETIGMPEKFKGYYYRKYLDGEWSVVPLEDKPSEDEVQNGVVRNVECGPISFELMIWDRDELENVVQMVGGGIRSIRKDLDAIAGINIYRDGFRVLPYGEPDNDWLRLDLRRVQNPTKNLSNNQITGYITISADENPGLHDRSNREGLDNNAAYSDLQDIMKNILTSLEGVRWVSKRPKNPKNKEDTPQKSLFAEPDFAALKESVKNEAAGAGETIKLISQVEADWKKQVKEFQNVLSQYHALATLGGIVDKVLHDGRQPLSSIQAEAGLGKELIQELLEVESDDIESYLKDVKSAEKGFSKIVDQANILRDVFRRVEPFGGRKRGRPKKYYIEHVIKDTFFTYRKELEESNIQIDIPSSETLVSIDTTELSEIFTNLITNSIYWLSMVPDDKRSIRVLISRLGNGGLEILFSDTGPGIDSKYKNHIFDPYFSTKPGGHGLGLSLVGEIVKDYYNGTVELLDSGKEWGAVFRLVIMKRV